LEELARMASRQGRVARVKLHASERIVVTCEHASNALPRGIGQVGASAAALRSHAAWDRGSREVASILAHRLGAAHFAGRYTRLLVDLNRSRGSKSLIPKERSGYSIAGNRKLSRKDREERIEKYYTPYREVVEAAVREALAAEGMCPRSLPRSMTRDGTPMSGSCTTRGGQKSEASPSECGTPW
jgi:predicted N-formylglutamate amidohydrolase